MGWNSTGFHFTAFLLSLEQLMREPYVKIYPHWVTVMSVMLTHNKEFTHPNELAHSLWSLDKFPTHVSPVAPVASWTTSVQPFPVMHPVSFLALASGISCEWIAFLSPSYYSTHLYLFMLSLNDIFKKTSSALQCDIEKFQRTFSSELVNNSQPKS